MKGPCHGFVLVGGKSSRMGQDKALLEWNSRPLALHLAEAVARATSGVALVGSHERYGSLGLPVIEDVIPGKGPLSGIHAVLKATESPLNLVVGCDMPFLNYPFLKYLVRTALVSEAQVIVPESPEFGFEPLCAVYNRDMLPAVEQVLEEGLYKLSRLYERARVRRLAAAEWQPYDAHGLLFENVNTQQELENARRQWESLTQAAAARARNG